MPRIFYASQQLSEVFNRYGELCEALGESAVAEQCFDRAALRVTAVESEEEAVIE